MATVTQIRTALDLAVSAYIRQFRKVVRTAGTIETKMTFGDRPWPPIYGIAGGASLGSSSTGPDGQTSLPTLQASGTKELMYLAYPDEGILREATVNTSGYGPNGLYEEQVVEFPGQAVVRIAREVWDQAPSASYVLYRVVVDKYINSNFIVGVDHKWGIQPSAGTWQTVFKAWPHSSGNVGNLPGLQQPADPESYYARRTWASVYALRNLATYYQNTRSDSGTASKLNTLANELESFMIEMWDAAGYSTSERYDNLTPLVQSVSNDPGMFNRKVLEAPVRLRPLEDNWRFFGSSPYRTRFGIVPNGLTSIVDRVANLTWWGSSEWRRGPELANKARLNYSQADLEKLYHLIESTAGTDFGLSTWKAFQHMSLGFDPIRDPIEAMGRFLAEGSLKTAIQVQKEFGQEVYRAHSTCAYSAALVLMWSKVTGSLKTAVASRIDELLDLEIGLQVQSANQVVEWYDGVKSVLPDCVGWVPWEYSVRGGQVFPTQAEWLPFPAGLVGAFARQKIKSSYQAPWLGRVVGGSEAQLPFIISLWLADEYIY